MEVQESRPARESLLQHLMGELLKGITDIRRQREDLKEVLEAKEWIFHVVDAALAVDGRTPDPSAPPPDSKVGHTTPGANRPKLPYTNPRPGRQASSGSGPAPLPQPHPWLSMSGNVWAGHIVPMLRVGEAVRLSSTCKTLRGYTRSWPLDLGYLPMAKLRGALACFPAARSVALVDYGCDPTVPWEACVTSWLQTHGQGGGALRRVVPYGPRAERAVSAALRAGALKGVRNASIDLRYGEDRALVEAGGLTGVQELKVRLSDPPRHDEVAALALLGGCSVLQRLLLEVCEDGEKALGVGQWPVVFLPRALRSLTILLLETGSAGLLDALPEALRAGGVKLESFDLTMTHAAPGLGESGVVVLLRYCWQTLRSVRLDCSARPPRGEAENGLLATLLRCPRLQALQAPIEIFLHPPKPSPSPSPSRAFLRLTDLEVTADSFVLGGEGLWCFMAQCAFPALKALRLSSYRRSWPVGEGRGEGVRLQVVPAFEAVADTLQTLQISVFDECELPRDVLLQLGSAIGRLRRLHTLGLRLSESGGDYHTLARGMDDGACPLLSSVEIRVSRDAACLARRPSLIRPSVEVVMFTMPLDVGEVLLLCCGLLELRYRRVCIFELRTEPGRGPMQEEIKSVILQLLQGLQRVHLLSSPASISLCGRRRVCESDL
jgi:hypothetical protein